MSLPSTIPTLNALTSPMIPTLNALTSHMVTPKLQMSVAKLEKLKCTLKKKKRTIRMAERKYKHTLYSMIILSAFPFFSSSEKVTIY
jgi:hypothetical protein